MPSVKRPSKNFPNAVANTAAQEGLAASAGQGGREDFAAQSAKPKAATAQSNAGQGNLNAAFAQDASLSKAAGSAIRSKGKALRGSNTTVFAAGGSAGSHGGSTADNASERGYDFSVLRLLRKREGLTLEALASTSGVSVAVLSKLERNQSRAELDTLYKVARAFNLSASDLIGLAEARLAKNVRESRYEHDGFNFRKIAYGNSTCFYGTAEKGKAVRRPEIHHDDYETCWVLKGCIRINLPQERREVRSGEAVQFDAVLEHTYEALEDSEFILTHVRKENRL